MQYYLEVSLLPDDDASVHFLWFKLYTQLHIAFAEHKDADNMIPYGVSFPEYKTGKNTKGEAYFTLGKKLRVFAETEALLGALNLNRWLERLKDYMHIKPIKAVPAKVSYYTFERARPKKDKLKRIKSQAERRNISIEESAKYFENYVHVPLDLPYVSLKSLSNESPFNLFIERKPAQQAVKGTFGTYGLSQSATVPIWSE